MMIMMIMVISLMMSCILKENKQQKHWEHQRTSTTSPEMLGPIPQHLTQGTRIKILPPKSLLQRLPPLVAQVQSGNTSENFLNELGEIIYSFY